MKKHLFAILLSALCAIGSASAADKGPYANQRFTVISPGLAVAVCDTFDSNEFAFASPTLPIHIENGIAKHSAYNPFDFGGFFGKCNGVVAEPLKVGEVVVATGSRINGHEFRLSIVSAPHAVRRGIGAFEHSSYESGAAELRFKSADPKDRTAVDSAIKQWLQPTSMLPGNTASGIQVPQIREGMNMKEVESALGAPDFKFTSEGYTTYRYNSAGVFVVFKDDKVTKIVTGNESVPAGVQPPKLPEATRQAVIENSEASQASPAAAASLADIGHVLTQQEQANLIQQGQASKCAVVTIPPGAQIDIDGSKMGVSPVVFVLLRHGETPRTITIKMTGYRTIEKKFVPDGKTIPIGIQLEKETP